MKLFILYLKEHRLSLLVFAICTGLFFLSFWLEHVPVKAVIYPALLCALAGLALLIVDYRKVCAKHQKLKEISNLSAALINSLPAPETIAHRDYNIIIEQLCREQRELLTDMNIKYGEMIEYYTMWAHQIKTPIASMRLNLQNEDSPLSRKLSADLLRIEQYVEMVLMFLRLDSDFTDYVIKEYEIDDIIRSCVKKFSGEFISRKLTLEYEPLNQKVITDEKWLSFVIEQILSNALKYTINGGIKIELEEPQTLCITDTGIGIAPEDLPRIFDKGYTGYNGRRDKKASGIGLYLCKRVCRNLGHSIKITSSLDEGTTVYLDLSQTKIEFE